MMLVFIDNLEFNLLSTNKIAFVIDVCNSKRIKPCFTFEIYDFTEPIPLPIRLPLDFLVTGKIH